MTTVYPESTSIVTSAGGLMSLLDESEKELQIHALLKIYEFIDQLWPEISDDVTKIEVMYEDRSFPERELAALVVSRVYYYLGEYDEALQFALASGTKFLQDKNSSFKETLIFKCIDTFIQQSSERYSNYELEPMDERLSGVVEGIFQKCYANKEWRHVLGIAIEAHRLDLVEYILNTAKDDDLKPYVLELVLTVVLDIEFRNRLLRLLLSSFLVENEPDYFSVGKCVVHLNDASVAAKLLMKLSSQSDDKNLLTAYQLAFDLEDSAPQEFLNSVIDLLPAPVSSDHEGNSENVEVDESSPISRIHYILSGEQTVKYHREFLYSHNNTDMLILNKTKDSLESRNSIFHNAVTFANAFMNFGTSYDNFFRENLSWLSKANNWSKFTATAALGVIHRGYYNQAMNIVRPYLPEEDAPSSSVYSEGGAYYAMGLINANHGRGVTDYLREQLKRSEDETVQYGLILGLGLTGMASRDEGLFDAVKTVLFNDNAVAGSAAGISMGLIMLGTASSTAIDEMLQYAHETQHEKIIRGLGIGIALIVYGRQQEADSIIEQLNADSDPVLRYGGMFATALAYCGTGNSKIIRKLLHVSVSDVNDDVRRAAVCALGFICFKDSTVLISTVELLVDSYNPHVRYGSAIALGIACANSGSNAALELLGRLVEDATDFVRQGAMIAQAMILTQHNEHLNTKVSGIRKHFEQVIGEKHEDALAKLGATLAQGIIDAGGRNVTIALQTATGSLRLSTVVGLAVFLQYWYWFPLTHFMSLSFSPTALIGLNQNLDGPKFNFVSNAKPKLFAYPAKTVQPAAKAVQKVETAVLSTTVKAKARAKRAEREKHAKETEDDMKVDKKPDEREADSSAMDIDEEKPDDATKSESTRKEEPKREVLENFTRVVPAQLPYISFNANGRYYPVRKFTGGVLMLIDRESDKAPDLIELSRDAPTPQANAEPSEQEAAPPEDFEYPFDDDE
ncbi:19S proteasome regulatory subunit Rpn2 [Schizosaccharomyces cryophilus OY26]|uniref:26S proteasome regulatory subunit RPN2 n=1 Tax=Schizosaccharomyces cryophilus (strain OY26 / ATCC MYA-4695 / CBS 11777 / NBRC 106824 / NRRL Y48691) TaxID=653667 RepID=S9VRV4_SCHCR|nr:19S proteasome regulatory subunit Rpn2 [Schizosaccharomyces cryophilus OY26]EPY50668.1 19S proteasome regulatory subunit Rpn2 [Schizosaccharomyces cryophilus OY26]